MGEEGVPGLWKIHNPLKLGVEAVFWKLHQVVVALEVTAAVAAHAEVFNAAREVRRAMDASELWKRP